MTQVIAPGTPPVPHAQISAYPVRVVADPVPDRPSRGLWLVKWLLVIPHLLVLVALWTAFVVLTVVALVAILVTGRYPRAIFDFNVGVLRWSWRVAYYSYGALGTDRYPPFTLEDDPTYPARLEVDPPGELSRGLVLVKWWLLALPHYLILAFVTGPGFRAAAETAGGSWRWEGGLLGVLLLVAAVMLLFTGRYPQGAYDLVIGLQRWMLRVSAYAALMTDVYPPFRLEQGGRERSASIPEVPVRPATTHHWTSGPVVAVTTGALALVTGLALASGGVVLQTWSDGDWVTGPAQTVQTDGYAVVSAPALLEGVGLEQGLGEVRVRAEALDGQEVFVGIATEADADAYLSGVARTELTGPLTPDRVVDGSAPVVLPQEADIWLTSSDGPGVQTARSVAQPGTWVAVVMPADAAQGLRASLDVGATLPWLPPVGSLLIALGAVLAVGGALAVGLGTRAVAQQG